MPESTAPSTHLTPAETAFIKAARAEQLNWQAIADWYRQNPDPAFGPYAQLIAEGTAQRIEAIPAWMGWEASKREQRSLAAVR